MKILNLKRYVCILTFMYTLPEISAQLAIEMYAGATILFLGHPYIDCTTILSDTV